MPDFLLTFKSRALQLLGFLYLLKHHPALKPGILTGVALRRSCTGSLAPVMLLFALGTVLSNHNREPGLNSSGMSAPHSPASWAVSESNDTAFVHVLKPSTCLMKSNEIIQCAREILGTNVVPAVSSPISYGPQVI